MKRFLALLALVLVLTAGTAGMASAVTIGFGSTPPVYDPTIWPPNLLYLPEISGTTYLYWDGTGYYGGHLAQADCTYDSTISFAVPTFVNNFQMSGHGYTPVSAEESLTYIFGPMTIAARNAEGGTVWTKTVSFDSAHRDLSESAWLTVEVNTAGVSSIIFSINPSASEDGPFFWPSIDNLVINAVPIPASVWLLGSGLLALVGLRRKFTR